MGYGNCELSAPGVCHLRSGRSARSRGVSPRPSRSNTETIRVSITVVPPRISIACSAVVKISHQRPCLSSIRTMQLATSVLLKKRTHAPNHKITAGSEARRLLLEAVACSCLIAASRAAERLCREVTRRNI